MAELLERIEAALDRIDYSARRYYVDKFMAEQIGQVPLSARILDVGGLRTGKRGLFDLEATGRQAVYVNLSAKRAPHVLGSAEALPLAPASFDAVIAAELLEHLQEPKTALVEMAHVLRPEGLLILTVPFLFRIHADPADWARYTETYLRSVLEETGFEAVKIEPQGGFFVQLAELARDYFYRLPPGSGFVPSGLRRLLSPFWRQLRTWAIKRDGLPISHLQGYVGGYGILARRRGVV